MHTRTGVTESVRKAAKNIVRNNDGAKRPTPLNIPGFLVIEQGEYLKYDLRIADSIEVNGQKYYILHDIG